MWDKPWFWIIIVVVIVLLFGAPKLPALAKSLGQSMRIFRGEVKSMKKDDESTTSSDEAPADDTKSKPSA